MIFRRIFRLGVAAGMAVLMVALSGPSSAATKRELLDTEIFAPVPYPGHPEGIVTDDDGTVYVGTHQDATGSPGVPSHVFAYNEQGELKRDYVISGQANQGQGIMGMAMDGNGLLYILDRNPSRVITLNPKTGEQRDYAYFRDVPPCSLGQTSDCSATVDNDPAFADYLVFAPDGTLYVTDINQALIWRIPPGGGQAKIWFTHPSLDSVFGPNGIQFMDNGRTLLFAQSLHAVTDPTDMATGAGRLYTLPIRADGSPGEFRMLWEGQPGEAPDGFAIGSSGRIYVALALGNALMVLSPDGQEVARTPKTAADNAQQEVPYDTPASVAFLGDRALITNQAYLGGPAEHQVVLSVKVGEQDRPLFRPRL